MPKESQIDPRNLFPTRWLPWILGAIMLLVYGITLNHWVTVLNLGQVAAVSGWMWQPQLYQPLTYLVTLPFRVLPAAAVPMSLNLFSALCASVALVLLARSVAILPHDRTEMERLRERSDFSFLTGWVAWIPPVVAVIFAGFQLSFWENATNFTGESFQLLWFAIILNQLLEYRLDEREGRLYVVALMYGAGITDNWAYVGYFPLFLAMLIWLRRLEFFNVQFLGRMFMCGLAGLLLFFLLPVLAKLTADYPLTFWQALKPGLQVDWTILKSIKVETVRHSIGLISLTSLLPAVFMSIRWSSSFGDSSRTGTMLVNYMLHVVNAIIFGVLLWVMFDPPFSARELMNTPALSLNFISALCMGYYCGYAILVFGKKPRSSRRNFRPEPPLPKSLAWLSPFIVTGTLALAALCAGLLLYKNVPVVRSVNDDTMLKYAKFSAQNLPKDHAIVLCDSDDATQDSPLRAFLLQAFLAREGREKNYPVVDTRSLNWATYNQYLHRRYPAMWPETATTNEIATGAMYPLHIFYQLHQFAATNNLCYLNPSFGYYFEQFYQEPHGLVYAMKTLPEDTLLPPPLSKDLIAENDAFWNQVTEHASASVHQALNPPDYTKQSGVIAWLMMHLHVPSEPNINAVMAGGYYSRGLDFYAVQLQRTNQLEKAAKLFAAAKEMNPENVVAVRNLEFNKLLRSGSESVRAVERVSADQFGKARNWNEVLGANGPYDDTSFCFEYGAWLMQAELRRQAVGPFTRVRQLSPNNLAARLFLAQIYIFNQLPDRALEALHDPMTWPLRFALTDFNSTELNVLAAAAYLQKNETAPAIALLEQEIERHPDNNTLQMSAAQSFMMHGLYTNALRVINHKLARSPDDVQWVYGKAFASLQIGAYHDAEVAFTRVLDMQTNNPDALFNRAFAYYQDGKLDSARADFRRLQSSYTNAFQVAYGLGEIAWRKHETNEAIHNYQIYLANAPTNSAELKTVRERLESLKR